MGDKIRETLTKTDPETNEKLQNLINTLYKRSTETATTVDIKSYRIVNIPAQMMPILHEFAIGTITGAGKTVRRGRRAVQARGHCCKQHLPDATLAKWLYEHLKTEQFQKRLRERTKKE